MVQVMHLYLDDSGTRHPDRVVAALPAHGRDWFALGGVVIKQEDEEQTRAHHQQFMERWDLDPKDNPLHSSDIRSRTGDFTWLAGAPKAEADEFIEGLYDLMSRPPFLGFACVIDRPGYDARYRERYGRERWSLCKTAFAVLVERAAKYARSQGYKLKVFAEKTDRTVDGWMKGYYSHLREHGMPFAAPNMEQYAPLTADEMKDTLYEFRTKGKTSPIMQIADLYLWPMAMGGYHRSNKTYARLMADGKLIDCHVPGDAISALGIKYSCWENVILTP